MLFEQCAVIVLVGLDESPQHSISFRKALVMHSIFVSACDLVGCIK